MNSSNDTKNNIELHFPARRPLSAIGRCRLPRPWRLPEPLEVLGLPEDPIEFIKGLEIELPDDSGVDRTSSKQSARSGDDVALTTQDLIEFALQTWRLQSRLEGMDKEANVRIYKQFSDSVRRFLKLLERFNVEFEDPTGKPFSTGWREVRVVSWDEPGESDAPVEAGPWIKQTVYPIIRREGVVIKVGEVICVEEGA